MSENYQELFDLLKKHNLTPPKLKKTIRSIPLKNLNDLYLKLFEITPYASKSFPGKDVSETYDPYTFLASTSLGGDSFPCQHLQCRAKRVTHLAKFSALYANQVLIYHPVRKLPEDFVDYDDIVRDEAYIQLSTLYYLKPLLDAKIVGLMPRELYLCPNCNKDVIKAIEKLDKTINKLAIGFSRQTEIRWEEAEDGKITAHLEGGNGLFEDHGVRVIFDKKFHKMSKKELILDYLERGKTSLIRPSWNRHSYITDLSFEANILEITNKKGTANNSRALMDGISHAVPFIENVPVQNLINLRKKEGEAFNVYRDVVTGALKSMNESTYDNSVEIFNDTILPELNKINNVVKNTKKLLAENVAQDLIIGAGFIGIGLFSGIVPPNFGACLGAMGGYKFITGVAEQIRTIATEPSEIRNNSYYFLWKLHKECAKIMAKKKLIKR